MSEPYDASGMGHVRRRRLQRRLAGSLADRLGELLERQQTVEGFTATQLARARQRIDEIGEDSSEALDDFVDALGRHYTALPERTRGAMRGPFGDGLPGWLTWALQVIVNAAKFLIEHPALVKFLLSLLIGVLDDRFGMPTPAGS